VTQVTGLFYNGAHATTAHAQQSRPCNNGAHATFVALASPTLGALAALRAFFKEIGDEQ
jgi:hypothetical protein